MSFQAQLDTTQAKTGKGPEDFIKLAQKKGLTKPGVKAGEIRVLRIPYWNRYMQLKEPIRSKFVLSRCFSSAIFIRMVMSGVLLNTRWTIGIPTFKFQ